MARGRSHPAMAQKFKVVRLEAKRSPRTVAGNLDNLNIVYAHWWCGVCKVLDKNPFADVEPPRQEKRPPRLIEPTEFDKFLKWFAAKYGKWRLPVLLLEVKSLTGCRIGELASTSTASLKDGRLCFEAVTTKGRKQRSVRLPPVLYEEVRKLAGPHFVFERFSAQLRSLHLKRGKTSRDYCDRFGS